MNYNDIEKDIEDIKKKFNTQMNNIDHNLSDLHKQLILISSKYPEQKEIVEFILFINDRMETNQTQTKEIFSEVINDIITVKQNMFKYCVFFKNKTNISQTISSAITKIIELKWLITFLIIGSILLGIVVFPESGEKLLNITENITKVK